MVSIRCHHWWNEVVESWYSMNQMPHYIIIHHTIEMTSHCQFWLKSHKPLSVETFLLKKSLFFYGDNTNLLIGIPKNKLHLRRQYQTCCHLLLFYIINISSYCGGWHICREIGVTQKIVFKKFKFFFHPQPIFFLLFDRRLQTAGPIKSVPYVRACVRVCVTA